MRNSNSSHIAIIAVDLVLLLAAGVKKFIRFLKEVQRYHLWKEFWVSLALLIGALYLAINFLPQEGTNVSYNGVQLGTLSLYALLGIPIAYCTYWGILFEKAKEKISSSNWCNRDWWWTLDGWEFEEEVAKIFRRYGYRAKVTKKTGDGGVDIILERNGETSIVQCKHYSDGRTPSMDAVRALYGVKEDFHADNVMMVASSGLTQAGYDFTANKPDYLVLDLDDIIKLVEDLEYDK